MTRLVALAGAAVPDRQLGGESRPQAAMRFVLECSPISWLLNIP